MASAAFHTGSSNGTGRVPRTGRFSDIPQSIDIPVSAGDDEEDDETAVVEVDPDALPDDPTELCTLLENERSPKQYWMYIALAYAKHEKVDIAIEIMTKGLQARAGINDVVEKKPMLNLLTWLYLQRAREAPKNIIEGSSQGLEAKTKEYYLQLAIQTLNESTRLDSTSTSTALARGVYSVLKSAVPIANERNHHLDAAVKIFDDAIRLSRGGNMLGAMGKARSLYGKKRYDQALGCYQEVLMKRPDMDPDPRLGIGLCFWHLGHKDDARMAWERALEIDPDSKVGHMLMAYYYLYMSAALSEYDPQFIEFYRKVMDHTQKAYKVDKNFPPACTIFASHFFSRKGFTQCEALAKKAIEYTDVSALQSDGYYLLGRKYHAEGDYEKALQHYKRSDALREGGFLPAKMGIGQAQVLMKDISSAKYTFEGIVQSNPKCIEAKTVLGTLYADEVLSVIPRSGFVGTKEDVTALHKKAIGLLETVRISWKANESKKIASENEALLLTLARLYENDQPDKAILCLQQVEQIYKDLKEADEDVVMPLQLLNNMAAFYWQQEKYDFARDLYQNALNSIPEVKAKDETADTDALATTLTYNLARCEEAAGNLAEATKHYEQLLQFHDDYVEANLRLAYMALRRGGDEGPKRVSKLMQTDGNNLEVRALYAWYLGKQKRKGPINIPEDPEQRHYKHTLQNHDKHDRFSLTGMGNLYLHAAREMRKESESDREKRRKTYEKAVEFFDKALQLDPKNAYAAQGIAIAMVEDKKDLKTAIGVFSKVRETLGKDLHAVVNLGHCLAGLEQWGRAIESYETALNKFQQGKDPTTLSCLGRVWFARGKKERQAEPTKSLDSLKNALEYAKRALEIAPENVIFKFNVAFVQFQLVQMILQLPETQRTLVDMEAASRGLDEAIQTFSDVARSKSPPYPPQDIEARSTMGRNTLRKQLERAIQNQREYEDKNAAKLAEARRKREEELRSKMQAEEKVKQEEEERRRQIAEERRKMLKESRAFAERKDAEERAREDDEGEKKRKRRNTKAGGGSGRGRRGRKKDEDAVSDSESEDAGRRRSKSAAGGASDDDHTEKRPAKKRKKLLRRRAASPTGGGKFKSSEVVNSSDDEDDDMVVNGGAGEGAPEPPTVGESGEEDVAKKRAQRKGKRRAADSDDEDENMGGIDEDLFDDDDAPDDQPLPAAPRPNDEDMPDRVITPGDAENE
ncbi:protein required for normal CLN1 and CLN2 G1 cyclin expression [Rhizina undulata]